MDLHLRLSRVKAVSVEIMPALALKIEFTVLCFLLLFFFMLTSAVIPLVNISGIKHSTAPQLLGLVMLV